MLMCQFQLEFGYTYKSLAKKSMKAFCEDEMDKWNYKKYFIINQSKLCVVPSVY